MGLWNKYRAVRKDVVNLILHIFSIAKRAALRYVPKASPYFHRLGLCILLFCSFQVSAEEFQVSIGQLSFRANLASSYAEKVSGLSNLDSIASDYGMLFDFGESKINCFYMANTKIPLTAVFIGANWQVLDVQRMDPLSTNLHCAFSRYGFEVSSAAVSNPDIFFNQSVVVLKSSPQNDGVTHEAVF